MRYLVLVMSLFLISSCAVDDNPVTFFNVNEDHTIALSQTLSGNGGSLAFELITNQELKCDNLALNYVINQNDESVTMWLNGYDNVKKCSNVPGIIKTNIPLKYYNRDIPLKIIMKYESAVEKNGLLKINEGVYSLNIDNDFGIVSRNNSLRLIDVNTYWGQIWSSDTGSLPDEIYLNDLLKKYGFVSPVAGNYTFFTMDKTFLTLHDQSKKQTSFIFAGITSKSNFSQFINELNANSKNKYLIKSFDDKKYEK
jgi:hypothetical protein